MIRPNTHLRRVLLSGISCALSMVSGHTASAESSDTEENFFDEIVVTARKRSEVITDVPATITAFSARAMDRAGIKNLDDLGRALPNVILNRRGDNEPNVVIRGIGAFGNVQGIGFYVDDVQNFMDQSTRIVDLERIEVLKGPQGTLYGGSSIGGAVKYVTKKPSEELEGKASIEVGDRNTINVNGSVNFPLSDIVFARISAYSDNTDGFSKNSLTGENNDKSREYGIRGALRITPSDTTDIIASFRWSDVNNGGNDYYVTDSVADYRYGSDLNENIFNKRQIFGGTLSIDQDVSDTLSLTSITAYTSRKNKILWDLDYGPLDGVIASHRDPVSSNSFSQELRLASENDGPFNWMFGLYGARTRDRLLVIQADVTIGSDFNDGVDLVIEDFNNSTSLDKNYAAFVNATYQVGDLEIGLGGRLNYNDFTVTNFNLGETMSFKDTTFLPRVSLSYDLTEDAMLYATFSKGYEPGKVNAVTDALASFLPEKTTNYELGIKGKAAGGMVTYELAGFYISNTDRQFETQVLNDDEVPVDLTSNIGDSRSYGLEAAVAIRPIAGLTLTAGGGWLDAKYKTANFLLVDYDGNKVPYAPEFSANANVDYEIDIAEDFVLSMRADVQYVGSFVWDIPNMGEQVSYTIVGARIALADAEDRWEISVRVNNIFNEGYHSEFLYNFAGDPAITGDGVCDSCHLARVGDPRMMLATFTYNF